jgi:hypothetical protein
MKIGYGRQVVGISVTETTHTSSSPLASTYFESLESQKE